MSIRRRWNSCVRADSSTGVPAAARKSAMPDGKDRRARSIPGPAAVACHPDATRVRGACACRIRAIEFVDLLQGRVHQDLEREVGDFVLFRADRVFAYHLACALDDHAQGITHVVRGADLLASTPRQIYSAKIAGPAHAGLPALADRGQCGGEKLSKQTLASPVEPDRAAAVLADVLGSWSTRHRRRLRRRCFRRCGAGPWRTGVAIRACPAVASANAPAAYRDSGRSVLKRKQLTGSQMGPRARCRSVARLRRLRCDRRAWSPG